MTPGSSDNPAAGDLPLLIDAYCHGTATDAQLAALAGLLRTDPAARRAFADALEIHAALRWRESAGANAEPSTPSSATLASIKPAPTPARTPTLRPPKRLVPPLALAAALLLAAAAVAIYLVAVSSKPETSNPKPAAAALVATVTDTLGGTLVLDDAIVAPGQAIRAGHLTLDAGSALVELVNGVEIGFSGGGELTVHDPMNATLGAGWAAFDCPRGVTGYTLELPGGLRVVDLGTRFAAHVVPATGVRQVHVIEGSVELRWPDGRRHALGVGQAASIDSADRLAPVPVNVFAFPLRGEAPAARWAEFADRLTLDADLLLLARFAASGDAPAAVDRSSRRIALRVQGAEPVAGRFGDRGDAAVHLGSDDQAVAFDLPGEYRALTMAAWVRLDRLPASYVSLIQSDDYADGKVHWNLAADGSMGLGVGYGHAVRSTPVLGHEHVGRWVHLAATCEADSARVAMYVDGRAVHDRPLDKPLDPSIGLTPGQSRIGNWNREPRPLPGAVADVVVFGRALSATEIQTLYAAGDPGR